MGQAANGLHLQLVPVTYRERESRCGCRATHVCQCRSEIPVRLVKRILPIVWSFLSGTKCGERNPPQCSSAFSPAVCVGNSPTVRLERLRFVRRSHLVPASSKFVFVTGSSGDRLLSRLCLNGQLPRNCRRAFVRVAVRQGFPVVGRSLPWRISVLASAIGSGICLGMTRELSFSRSFGPKA